MADAYDAMTTERVYGTRLSPAQALAELGHCAGTQFDPIIVAAFVAEERGRGARRCPERLVELGLGVDLDLGALVSARASSPRRGEAHARLARAWAPAPGRGGAPHPRPARGSLRGRAPLRARGRAGGADQDAKGADRDWTTEFSRIPGRSASPDRGVSPALGPGSQPSWYPVGSRVGSPAYASSASVVS